MSAEPRRYLALGDSISIDLYTGIPGGGAVSQFYDWLKSLGQSWTLDNRAAEPSLQGAAVIASLFKEAVVKAGGI